MMDPEIGRFLSPDPAAADPANLYRYCGNDPVNKTDPSGLASNPISSLLEVIFGPPPDAMLPGSFLAGQPSPLPPAGSGTPALAPAPAPAPAPVIITVDNRPDYKGFDRAVSDFSAILLDVLLSGSPDQDARKRASNLLGGIFEPKTFFGAMTDFCKNKYGDGWTPVPIEFRLTGLQFYPTQEFGGMADKPRAGIVHIPTIVKKTGAGDPELKVYDTAKEVPLAHFYIEGYWVFKCVDAKEKKESPLYAIPTEGKVHTMVHAPYNDAFRLEHDKILNDIQKTGDTQLLLVGRPYDRAAGGMGQKDITAIGNIFKYLRVVPGDAGKDLTIVHLADIWNKFKFPL
jgi:hypothetical protein